VVFGDPDKENENTRRMDMAEKVKGGIPIM